MRKQSASSTAASGNRNRIGRIAILLVAGLVVIGWLFFTNTPPSYTLDGQGFVVLTCPVPTVREEILRTDGNVTLSRIVYSSGDQDVFALLAAPGKPNNAIVLVPGAGVRKEAHAERAMAYARAGIATLVLDTRGNGGETPGPGSQIQEDYQKFQNGAWPVWYRSGCDIIGARSYLEGKFHTNIYAMGESNGGRVAVFAVASDPHFTGYIGVSTAGFDRYGHTVGGDAGVFIESMDPECLIHRISPRPVWILHAPADTFIPIADGIRLYENAGEPREFINFSGTHGINDTVDAWVIRTFGL